MHTSADLVRCAQAGDKTAFAELVRLYERSAIVTAHAVLGDFHAAQDAAQDGFVTAYQRLGQLREADAFGPWLLQIVRRRAGEIRTRRMTAMDPPDAIAARPDPSGWLATFEEVVPQINRLPEHERCVVVLRYFDGHSVAEIAQLTDRPIGTVTKQLSRAIERLKAWLVEVKS